MSRLAATFLLLAGVVHVVLGIAAITGAARLEENVREITTSPSGGGLYFSLGTWGLIVGLAGLAELLAAAALVNGARWARFAGLIAGFLALGSVFFSLPIFRWPSVATILPLLAASYVLTYRVADES